MNKEYLKNETSLYETLIEVEKIKKIIIKHGKVQEAISTGKRYQRISEDDAEIIQKSLDQLYTMYGKMSSCALALQAETVLLKNEFESSLREVEVDD